MQQIETRSANLRRSFQAPLPIAAGIRDGDYRFTPDGPGDEPVPGTTANRIQVDFARHLCPAAREALPGSATILPASRMHRETR